MYTHKHVKCFINLNSTVQMQNIVWKYWDNRNWAAFTGSIAKQINDAFKAGQHSIKFTNNRRRYMIDFVTMMQVKIISIFYVTCTFHAS